MKSLLHLKFLGAFFAAGSLAVAGDMSGAISAGKLAKEAKNFYGQTVTVKAEVEDILDNRTFTLDEDAILAGPDVLVVVPKGSTTGLKHDDVVTVTGTVRPFVQAELERDYDWFKDGKILKKDTKIDYTTRPVLIATSIKTADGRDLSMIGTAAMHSGHDSTIAPPARASLEAISAGKLARDAKKFYGQTVTVRAEVESVLDDHTFTLDEDDVLAGPDVLVVVPRGTAKGLMHDQVVTVTGTVRPFVQAELERDYDWFKDGKILKKDVKIDYKTRPVLIAQSVRTESGSELISE
jgi:hypothetical protein